MFDVEVREVRQTTIQSIHFPLAKCILKELHSDLTEPISLDLGQDFSEIKTASLASRCSSEPKCTPCGADPLPPLCKPMLGH